MTISLRLSDEDAALFKKYADMNGITLSELVRSSVIERIEDELDLKEYERALDEYRKNPVVYSFDEVAGELERE